jgi:hypothetical protein
MATKKATYKNLAESYDERGLRPSEYSDKPFKHDLVVGASEYVGPNASTAGAGRGKQGGPTAGQLKAQEVEDVRDAVQKARAEKKGVTVDQMRKNMSDEFDKRVKAGDLYKKGGTVSASKRADGIAIRGKTRGKMC